MYYYNPSCPIGTLPYVVQPGDTLYNISLRYNTTVEAILKVNSMINPYCLRVGQILCIPIAPPTPMPCPAGTFAYTIQMGDTFYSIAARFHVTVEELIATNPGVNPDNLMPGQRICIPEMAPPVTCPEGTFAHTIKAGDTLYSLAQLYHTTVENILAVNPGIDPNNLKIGQKVCIPLTIPAACPEGTITHTIQSGDTFYNLAKQYNTTVEAIQAANPGVNPNNLQIGEKICIPKGTTPPRVCPTGTFAYTIRSGDTFYNLAKQYNTTVEAIQAANPGVDPNNLQIGQVICIPEKTTPPRVCPKGTFAYTIKSGDTFYNLARQYNTTVEAIQAANPGVNPNNLQIGQVICIPEKTTPPRVCPKGTFAHTIKSGDTFYNLARQYNTTIEAIQRANPNANPNNLIIGDTLCIPRA